MAAERARRASYAPSSSASATTTTASSASGSSANLTTSDGVRACGYCANTKQLGEILPQKKCDYCFQYKCQFCTLKFPLLKSKKGLPKIMKGNTRICLPCFDSHWTEAGTNPSSIRGKKRSDSVSSRRSTLTVDAQRESQWQRDSEWAGNESFDEATLQASRESLSGSFVSEPLTSIEETPTQRPGVGKRLAKSLGLVVQTEAPKPQHVIHVVDLWMSLFTAAILLAVALVQDLTQSQRICICVVIYGVFLALHPWIHNAVAGPAQVQNVNSTVTQPSATVVSRRTERAVSAASAPKPAALPLTRVPEIYQATHEQMQERFMRYVNDPSLWKLVKASNGGKVYEITTDRPEALFMLDVFVPGVTAAEFVAFMDLKDIKSRSLWDWNVAAFDVVENYPEDGACIVYNAQKPFLGGFVSARDFSLLYQRTATSIIYASVEHDQCPERNTATRGTVYLAGVHATPSTDEKTGELGCMAKYMVQVNIGGSIPTRMMYNGQVDNMEKVMKVFRQGRKVLAKSALYD